MSALFDHLDSALLVVDRRGMVSVCNRSLERLLGLDRARLVGRPWQQALTEALEGVVETSEHVLHALSREPAPDEPPAVLRVLPGEGRAAGWVRCRRTRVDDGESLFLVELVDVTAEHVAEQRLIDARDELRALIDAFPDGIVVHGPDDMFVDANENLLTMYGITREQLYTRPPAESAGHQMEIDEARRRVARARAGERLDFEWVVRLGDGSEIPVEVRLRRIEARGAPGGAWVAAFVRDLRAQRAAEAALRASEERYRAMFERNAAVKWLVDPSDGRILVANEAAARFYGWSKEQLTRMRVTDINVAPSEVVRRKMQEAMGERGGHFEFRHRKADGSIVDVEIHASPLELDGRPVIFSVVHDISRKRQLEEQLRLAQKMEDLGRLAGRVAHDFNNLMTIVVGASSVVLAQLPEGSPLREQVFEISEAGKRAGRLTRQLLALGRTQIVAARVVDVNAELARIVARLRPGLDPRIELVTGFAADPPWIEIDPDQLEQIVLNLALNARDAMPEGGTLMLRTERAHLPAERADAPSRDAVALVVRDTGRGIEPARLPRIFEPFYTTKPDDQGSGLGLAAVYGAVTHGGGRVGVESEPGRGTVFRVLLPAASAPAPPRPAREPASAHEAGRRTVLLVDDDELVRKLTAMMLDGLGYQVLSAGDGEEALAIASAWQGCIDLLLTDVMMPRMSGGVLVEKLVASRPDLRVLYVSGFVDEDSVPAGGGGARTAFLQKPITPDQLAARIRELLAP